MHSGDSRHLGQNFHPWVLTYEMEDLHLGTASIFCQGCQAPIAPITVKIQPPAFLNMFTTLNDKIIELGAVNFYPELR